MLEWIKVVGPILVSWPVLILIVAIVLRGEIKRLVSGFLSRSGGDFEFGPVKIRLGELVNEGQDAVARLNKISIAMAESRIIEINVMLEGPTRMLLSDKQQQELGNNLDDLRKVVEVASKALSDASK